MATNKRRKAEPKSSNNSTLIIMVLAIVGLWWFFSSPAPVPRPAPDDERSVVDDDRIKPRPVPDSSALKSYALVTIVDKKLINEDIEYQLTMQDDLFWDEMRTKLADVEHLEDDDEPAKRWLQASGQKPPLVMLVNVKTEKVKWCIPLPKGGTKLIRSKVGG